MIHIVSSPFISPVKQNQRLSVVDEVIQYIRDAILEGTLSFGQQIPPESELCSRLNISRASVREALKILMALGVLEIRHGEGTFVAKEESCFISTAMSLKLLFMGATVEELIDFRAEVEVMALKMAMRNINEEDKAELVAVLKRHEELLHLEGNGSIDDRYELDIEFHKKLGQCCHNKAIEEIYRYVIELFAPLIYSSYDVMNKDWSAICKIHQQTVDAIVNKDEQGLRLIYDDMSSLWRSLHQENGEETAWNSQKEEIA